MRQPFIAVFVGYFFLGTILYLNTLDSPFVFDDFHVVAGVSVDEAFARCRNPQRVLAHLSFALNAYLFGADVRGYHVVNILLHITTVYGVFLLLLGLLQIDSGPSMSLEPGRKGSANSFRLATRSPSSVKSERELQRCGGRACREPGFSSDVSLVSHWTRELWLALLGGALFLAHPVATQSVSYICQRYTSLAVCFMIYSLVAYMRARSLIVTGMEFWQAPHLLWYVGSLLLALCAMFTKEFPVILPVLVVLVEGFFFLRRLNDWRHCVAYLAPFVLTMAVVPYLYLGAHSTDAQTAVLSASGVQISLPHWAPEKISRLSYLLTQIEVVWKVYARLLILPIGQSFDHGYTIRDQFVSRPVLISLAGLILLLLLAAWAYRRARLVTFAILWFFASLIPTSTIVPSIIIVAEHRLYLGLVAPALLFVAGLQRCRCLRVIGLVAIPVLLVLSVATIRRNFVWSDALTLWTDASAKAPALDRPYLVIGDIYFERGQWALAAEQYQEFIQRNPNFSEAYIRLGWAYARLGHQPEALAEFGRAIYVNPDNPNIYRNLIGIYMEQKWTRELIPLYQKLIALEPENEQHYVSMAHEYVRLQEWEQAAAAFAKALQIRPGNVEINANLATVYKHRQQWELAEQTYRQALTAAEPVQEALIRHNLGDVYREQGRWEAAIAEYQRVLAILPGVPGAHIALAKIYCVLQAADAARHHAEAALRLGATPESVALDCLRAP